MEFIKLNIQLFGASNSASATLPTANNGSNKGKVDVSFTERDITSQNIIDNKTTIDLTGSFTQTSGYWSQISSPMLYLEWWDDKSNTWTIVASKNVTSVSRNVPITISGTIDVEHKADGDLNGKARTRWVYEASSGLVPRSGIAETGLTAMTQVPRKNTISSTSAYIEENPTITIGKKASSSTTTITWSCTGNGVTKSGIVATKTSASSITSWSIPTDVYSCISSTGKTATITLTATTYISDKALTETSSTTLTATVKKERNLPNISITAKDINTATKNLTGNENVVVLNASAIECTYSATAKNGATISSADINGTGLTVGSVTISGKKEISKPTTNVFKLTATDSRGFPNSKSDTKDYIPYFVPTLNATIERNTPTDGLVNIAFSGTYFSGNFSSSNKNELTVEYRYAEKGSSLPDWTAIEPYKSGNNFSNNGAIQLSGFDYQKAYTVQLKVSDKLNSKTISQDISVGRPSPWWDKENMYIDGSYYKRDENGVLIRNSTPVDVIELEEGTYLDNIKTPGFYTGNSGLDYYQTPAPDGPFTLEVFVAPDGNIKQVYHKHRENNGSRDNWSVATFERSFSNYWTRWTCVSGYIHAYSSDGANGWYKILTLSSTSGWANSSGTISITTTGSSIGSLQGEVSFWFYNNDAIKIRVLNGNMPVAYFKAIKFSDNSVGFFVCTRSWYGPVDVKIKEMTMDYHVSTTPEFIGSYGNLPSGTDIGTEHANLYSTSETDFGVGQWIDGKTIFRKVIATNENVVAGTTLAIAHGITNYGTIWVDLGNSFYFNASTKRSLPMEQTFYTSTSDADRTHVYIDGDYIYIVSVGGWGTHWQKVITLNYTKAIE